MKDLTGQRFGRLVVESRSGSNKRGLAIWQCRCDCGNTVHIVGANLRGTVHHKGTKSCGCLMAELSKERLTTHGMTHSSLSYKTWIVMRRRCNDPKHSKYKYYGGKGITVCERWSDFGNFHADMGERPRGMTIGRVDNSKGYSPDNCKWVTWTEQQNNRSSNHTITYGGVTLSVADWSRKVGLSQSTLLARIHKGWSVERSLTEPLNNK